MVPESKQVILGGMYETSGKTIYNNSFLNTRRPSATSNRTMATSNGTATSLIWHYDLHTEWCTEIYPSLLTSVSQQLPHIHSHSDMYSHIQFTATCIVPLNSNTRIMLPTKFYDAFESWDKTVCSLKLQ